MRDKSRGIHKGRRVKISLKDLDTKMSFIFWLVLLLEKNMYDSKLYITNLHATHEPFSIRHTSLIYVSPPPDLSGVHTAPDLATQSHKIIN